MCKISVMMSVFNESEYEIKMAVNSILKQTYSDFELIIVNDAPDNEEIRTLLQGLKDTDSRIVVLHNNKNIGLAMSMNHAAGVAKGKYLARMDADDVSLPERFAKQIALLDAGCADLIFTNYAIMDDNSQLLRSGEPELPPISNNEAMVIGIVFQSIIHHPTVMMSAELFNRVGGYQNYPCAQDHDLWLRMLEHQCRFTLIDEVLLYYRIRSESVSKKSPIKQQLTIYYALLLFIRRLHGKQGNFSIDNYQEFISKNLLKNPEKGYRKAHQLLSQATSSTVNRFKNRIAAFISSPVLRNIYLLKIFNIRYVRRKFCL